MRLFKFSPLVIFCTSSITGFQLFQLTNSPSALFGIVNIGGELTIDVLYSSFNIKGFNFIPMEILFNRTYGLTIFTVFTPYARSLFSLVYSRHKIIEFQLLFAKIF